MILLSLKIQMVNNLRRPCWSIFAFLGNFYHFTKIHQKITHILIKMNEMARKLIRPPPLPDMCAEDPHLICNFEPFFHLPIIQFGITETSLTVLAIEEKN